MPETYPVEEQKRQLECLRLASDLMQLASDSPDPDVQAHCLQMAKVWTDQADGVLCPAPRF